MWGIIGLLMLLVTLLMHFQNLRDQQEYKHKHHRINLIAQDAKQTLEKNPSFVIPEIHPNNYIKTNQKANNISINNYFLNHAFNKAIYTLKNNYAHDILITPELTYQAFDDPEGTAIELLFYDFDKAYKIIKPNEAIDLDFIITSSERAKVNRKDFKAYRLIYKNDEKRTVVGYIKIGDDNE